MQQPARNWSSRQKSAIDRTLAHLEDTAASISPEITIGTISLADTRMGTPYNRPSCGQSNSLDVVFEFTPEVAGPGMCPTKRWS